MGFGFQLLCSANSARTVAWQAADAGGGGDKQTKLPVRLYQQPHPPAFIFPSPFPSTPLCYASVTLFGDANQQAQEGNFLTDEE